MKKRLVPFLLVLSLAACLLLGGCGSAASTAADASGPESAPASAAESAPVPEPEPAPMPEPEPDPAPYVEEHALPFSPAEDFSAMAVMYNTDDMTLFEPIDALYTFEGVELTDNGDGTETLALRYIIQTMIRDFYEGPDYLSCRVSVLDASDAYTGIVFETSDPEEKEYTVTWQDECWPIAVSFEFGVDWGDWVYNEETGTYDSHGYMHCTNYATYPKGYDGLAFYVHPRLDPSLDEADGDEPESTVYLLDNWTEGSVLIRAADLIAAYTS